MHRNDPGNVTFIYDMHINSADLAITRVRSLPCRNFPHRWAPGRPDSGGLHPAKFKFTTQCPKYNWKYNCKQKSMILGPTCRSVESEQRSGGPCRRNFAVPSRTDALPEGQEIVRFLTCAKLHKLYGPYPLSAATRYISSVTFDWEHSIFLV